MAASLSLRVEPDLHGLLGEVAGEDLGERLGSLPDRHLRRRNRVGVGLSERRPLAPEPAAGRRGSAHGSRRHDGTALRTTRSARTAPPRRRPPADQRGLGRRPRPAPRTGSPRRLRSLMSTSATVVSAVTTVPIATATKNIGTPLDRTQHRHDRPAVRHRVLHTRDPGDRTGHRAAEHVGRNDLRGPRRRERDRALGDPEAAHEQRRETGLPLLLGVEPLPHQRGQALSQRHDRDRGGAHAHDRLVAGRDEPRAEQERRLVDRPAHVERDHEPQNRAEQDRAGARHPAEPAGQVLEHPGDRLAR